MAVALVGSGFAGSTTSHGITSDAFDTTGANFLVVSASFANEDAHTMSDSKSNTWSVRSLTGRHRIYYAYNATVGTGHTFTISGTSNFPYLCIGYFSGVKSDADPFDLEDSDLGFNTSVNTGAITPSENNCLVISGVRHNAPDQNIGVSGVTSLVNDTTSFAGSDEGSMGYAIQTTAASVSATWSADTAQGLYVGIASFKAAAAASPTSDTRRRRAIPAAIIRNRRR